MDELLPLGLNAWLFIGTYLASLIGVGFLARHFRQANTLSDFYLAGRGFGFFVLVMTLFATQYSGNTFFGFTGATYRIGFPWIMSMHFMTAIVIVYLTFAPKLHQLSSRHGFVTPPDFIQHRYGSRALTLVCSIIMIIAVSNFLLAQLMAMGRAMQGLATTAPAAAYSYGVVLLALIMVVYGTLGGLRAVAWTDAIQGILLLIGFSALVAILLSHYGSVAEASAVLRAEDLELGTRKTLPPTARVSREWLSYILMVGFGAALYPQAIQRIYAARSARTLRRSLQVMVFLPLFTMLIPLVTGIIAGANLPGLTGAASDQVLGRLLGEVQALSTLGYLLVTLMIAAVLAAMMSTADSALLSISSMLTKDIYAGWLAPGASQAALTRFGKRCSWTLITLLVMLAIALREASSLVALLDRKFDILVQLVPAFILGVRSNALTARPVLIGILVGVTIAMTLAFGGFEFVHKGKISGFHPGLIGLLPNLAIAVVGSRMARGVSPGSDTRSA